MNSQGRATLRRVLVHAAAAGNIEAVERIARELPKDQLAIIRERLARAILAVERVFQETP